MASKLEEKLTLDLGMYRALVLDKYPEPMPLDRKVALEETKDRTRFDQPVVHAFTISPSGTPVFGWFNKARDSFDQTGKKMLDRNWYDSPIHALIANRNEAARAYATNLARFDVEIATHLAGSGILPGVIVSKADTAIVLAPSEEPVPDGTNEGLVAVPMTVEATSEAVTAAPETEPKPLTDKAPEAVTSEPPKRVSPRAAQREASNSIRKSAANVKKAQATKAAVKKEAAEIAKKKAGNS
jgi:hypothetical protein